MWQLRKATVADQATIARLEAALFGAESWGAAGVAAELGNPARGYFVAEDGGEIIGYAGITLFSQADIMTVAVVPQCRRQGIAQALLQALEQEAEAAKVFEVFLEVRSRNEGARGLYEKNGYRAVREIKNYYHSPADTAVVMRKRLRAPLVVGAEVTGKQ
ncbi:MAG: ribosomal protein S18-alanine N-acetyltransferase [Actinomycetaceae bacterium]|nr:ribosomal protein S18-alanine N-acetyltransferase [Actinomycetaceae bacterium]